MAIKAIEFADFTSEEEKAVEVILDRAGATAKKYGVRIKRMSLEMDLAATHAKVPLRLADLAAADDFTFGHDIVGIISHMNRETGELGDYFLPRMAKRKK